MSAHARSARLLNVRFQNGDGQQRVVSSSSMSGTRGGHLPSHKCQNSAPIRARAARVALESGVPTRYGTPHEKDPRRHRRLRVRARRHARRRASDALPAGALPRPRVRHEQPVRNLDRVGFNDRASSVIVERGNWQVCEESGFRGRCIVLRPGPVSVARRDGAQQPHLVAASRGRRTELRLRAARPPPAAVSVLPASRRAPLSGRCRRDARGGRSARAALLGRAAAGRALRRSPTFPARSSAACWAACSGIRSAAARGNDVATAVGAVGGAALGANVNRGSQTYTQDVQRCASVPGTGQVAYWDVTYVFRGVTHRAQLAFAPGATINVNARGEPRV